MMNVKKIGNDYRIVDEFEDGSWSERKAGDALSVRNFTDENSARTAIKNMRLKEAQTQEKFGWIVVASGAFVQGVVMSITGWDNPGLHPSLFLQLSIVTTIFACVGMGIVLIKKADRRKILQGH